MFFSLSGVFAQIVKGSSTCPADLFPVCSPLHGVHQHDKEHDSQLLCEECFRVRPWGLEHRGSLQLHQRLSVPRAPGQKDEIDCCTITHKLSAAAKIFNVSCSLSHHPTEHGSHSTPARLASYVVSLHQKATKPQKNHSVQGKGEAEWKGGVVMWLHLHRRWSSLNGRRLLTWMLTFTTEYRHYYNRLSSLYCRPTSHIHKMWVIS